VPLCAAINPANEARCVLDVFGLPDWRDNRADSDFMRAKQKPAFDAEAFLRSAGAGKNIVTYRAADVIFSQGDVSDSVLYVQQGAVKLSVLSHGGKEAVVAMLGPGDFFGERALAGHPVRLEAATAMTVTTVLVIPKERMICLLHDQHAMSDRFITNMLARNIRIEEDLIDQLFNSSEKRLARTLLLLARYGKPVQTHRVLPRISQETLAEMIGTTRSRVNFFMNKFKKLGFIEYNGGLKVNHSLLTVILHN
jgi:CRP/FNR family cyclic AMP-dependent transcriptional regulator